MKVGKYKFMLNTTLRKNLEIIRDRAIPNKWDALFIIWGREGVGKSTLATQMAIFLDNKFSVKNIVFSAEQFKEVIKNAKPESTIIWDEAITGANISQHATEISSSIVSKMTQIRKKRLKIFLCFPYLYMLNKYFVARSIASIYIYAKAFDDRGYGLFYNSNQTEFLYNLMKFKYPYNYKGAINEAKISFHFRFKGKFCANEKIYEAKKDKSIASATNKKGNLWKGRFIKLLDWNNKGLGKTWKEIAIAMDMNRTTIRDIATS